MIFRTGEVDVRGKPILIIMYTQSLRAAVIPAVHYSGFIDANLCRAVSDCPFISLGSDIAIFEFFEGGRVNNIVLADDLHFFRAVFAAVDSQSGLVETARLGAAQVDVLDGRQFAACGIDGQPVSFRGNRVIDRGVGAGVADREFAFSAHSDAVRSIDHRHLAARSRFNLQIVEISSLVGADKTIILRGKSQDHVFRNIIAAGEVTVFLFTVHADLDDFFVQVVHHDEAVVIAVHKVREFHAAW